MSRRAVAGMAAAVSGPGPGPVFSDDFAGEPANISLGLRTGWQQLNIDFPDDIALQVRTDGTVKPRYDFPRGRYAPTTPLGQTDYYIDTTIISTARHGGHLIHFTDNDNLAYSFVEKGSATGIQVVEVVGGVQQAPLLNGDASSLINGNSNVFRTEVRGTEVRVFIDAAEVTGSPVTLTQTTPTAVAGLLSVFGGATTYQWITDFEYGTL